MSKCSFCFIDLHRRERGLCSNCQRDFQNSKRNNMLEPKTYRKKPVHVQAMRFDGSNANAVAEFTGEITVSITPYSRECDFFEIETLEGTMRADVGDYIIKGIAGEFYPCKPDIFKATYEEVDQDGNRVNSTQYPESANTPVMTVAAILEWLEGEKEDIEATRKNTEASYGALGTMTVNLQAETVQILIDNLTKSTFQQMDEAQHE